MRFNRGINLRGGGGGDHGGFGPIPESWMKKEQLFHYSPYFQLGMKRQQDLGGSEVATIFNVWNVSLFRMLRLRLLAGQH